MPDAFRHTDVSYPRRSFASRSDWERYATWLRRHARVSLALLPEPPRPALRPQVFGRWDGSGYSCEKVALEALPGYFVTGNLFRPSKENRKAAPMPGFLCPHGHWPIGRLQDFDPLCSIIARCVHFARMGATVFSYDMTGYNDSCQLDHNGGFADHSWGLSHMSLQVWNNACALEFLLGLPGVDPKRIGVTGASGGGTQTFCLMATDERVAAAAPICMVSYSMQGGCICENAPLLRLDATNVDLAGLFAPKPLFLGSCSTDWTKRTPKLELPALRELWRLYGAAKRVSGFHNFEQHNYNQDMREAVYGFFNKTLFGAASDAKMREDTTFARPALRDRLVWWGRPAPGPIADDELKSLWRTRQEAALKPHLRSAAAARKGLGALLPHVLGTTLTSVEDAAARKPEYLRITGEGDSLIVEPHRDSIPGADKAKYFTTYNRSHLAECVHEILGALAHTGARKLVGRRGAGMAALLAAAVDERAAAVEADLGGFDPASDASWKKRCDTPAIRQIGGLATVFACIGSRPVTLRHPAGSVVRLARQFGAR